ncbi:hypothetical protein JI749_06750 [Devosia oryziradicis]|uniref:Uncharacterized protein n=1 Tax=Devosia oryziradicis TaxID=2801335 RepID=A0ABX7C3R6_9HYPH|nr:hypothetical protein [Devosia oryziradicis]QQR37300.1 hypothetical protein JI749_06750 [Devosia oryziradicis]
MKLTPALPILTALGIAVLLLLPADLRAAQSVDLSDMATSCLETPLDDCKVFSAGYLNTANFDDRDGAPFLAWQTQLGSTPTDGIIGGFVLFQHDGTGWSVLDSGFDGFFDVPRLNQESLLHVPGYSQGTGSFNTDRLYQWGDLGAAAPREGWSKIEMDQWLNEVGSLLPAGLEIWKGVEYDFSHPYSGLVARTPLWRSDDANCCGTGGSAVISLDIVDGGLVATGVAYTPPGKTK